MEHGEDKVRKSGASYENIYHSTNVWLHRALELICVFLGGGASRDRMGNTRQPRTFFWAVLLIHNLLEAVIGSMEAEEMGEKGPGSTAVERPEMLLIDRRRGFKSNTHFGCMVRRCWRLKYGYIKEI